MKKKTVLLFAIVMTFAFGTTALAGHKKVISPSYSMCKLSIVSMIKEAKSGDKVYVYEDDLSKGKLPYYVLEALAGADNVTLVMVSEDGQEAEVNSEAVPKEGAYPFFTFDELLNSTK